MKSELTSLSKIRIKVALFVVAAFATLAMPHAVAQTFKVVHNFTGGNDGGAPLSGFIADSAGNLYGTASSGGPTNHGLVYKLSKTGAQTVIYNFADGTDGAYPYGALVRDKTGNLYGTTYSGGAENAGTVFEISPAGEETVLYTFLGEPDGANPQAGLTLDAAGNLYGTTSAGGANGAGTVFKLTHPKQGAKWPETVLHNFGAGTDGTAPVAGVTLDQAGNLYGTASAGGANGFGDIFQLVPAHPGWTENIIHDFEDGEDGALPLAGLISDKAGNFFGAASDGGTAGGGTIFELTPASGSEWTFTTLYGLAGWGEAGSFRNLLLDAAGNLYGTTHCDGAPEAGTVYKLAPASGGWTYTLLYTFSGGTDGQYSFSNLVLDGGKLYGTTNEGGTVDGGVVFEVTP